MGKIFLCFLGGLTYPVGEMHTAGPPVQAPSLFQGIQKSLPGRHLDTGEQLQKGGYLKGASRYGENGGSVTRDYGIGLQSQGISCPVHLNGERGDGFNGPFKGLRGAVLCKLIDLKQKQDLLLL